MNNLLDKVYKSGLRFLIPLTLEETYEIIVKEATRLVKGDMGSILLYKKGQLERVYASNPALYNIKPRKRGLMYQVYKSRQPRILTVQEIIKIHPEIELTEARADISIPLTYFNRSMGVLSILSTKKGDFTEKELLLLKLLGPLASMAIRKAQLYQELKRSLDVRDRFIALAAHELRTPLTSVNGYVQLLQSRMNNTNSTEGRWVQQLSWECLRLKNLVNELLEINRIKTGQLQYVFKECDLKTVITRARNDFKFTHPDRKIVFYDQIDAPYAIVIGDFDKLIQITTNLVDNAVKYSPQDTPIYISLRNRKNVYELEITDQGIGIPKNELPQVFEGFYKGEDNHKEGFGLGLYLSSEIIKKHSGTIDIKSKIGKGTSIKIKIPKRK